METFRWIAAGIMGLLFLYIALVNGAIFVQGFFLKKKTPSWIPLLGGALGAGALLVCPLPGAGDWWWAPLVIDFGCAPGFVFTGWRYLQEHLGRRRRKR